MRLQGWLSRFWESVSAVAALVCLAAVLVLVWPSGTPPLVDYPTHAARSFVLSLPDGSSGLLDFYRANWIPVPNLGIDVLLSSLMGSLPPMLASQLFLTFSVVLLMGGSMLWVRLRQGAWGPEAFLPMIALGDTWYRMGFANYVLGIGIATCAMCVWTALAKRAVWRRLLGVAPLVAVLAVVHLMALLVLLLWIMVEWVREGKGDRTATWLFAGVLPAGLVAVLVGLAAIGKTAVNPSAKEMALQGLLRMFGEPGSLVEPTIMVVALGLLAAWNWRSRAWILPTVALVAVAALGPSFFGGTAFSSERATLPLLVTMAVYSRPLEEAKTALVAILAGVCALVNLRSDLVLAAHLNEALTLAKLNVRQGDTLFTFESGRPVRPTYRRWHLHAADWLVLTKGVFVPQLFAKRLQQPMVFTELARPFKEFQGQEPIERAPTVEDVATMRRLQETIGVRRRRAYLLWFGPKTEDPLPIPGTDLVGVTSDGTALYRVAR